jgi:hypothetical protein
LDEQTRTGHVRARQDQRVAGVVDGVARGRELRAAGKPVLRAAVAGAPGIRNEAAARPLHGQRAAVSPKHSGVPTVQPLVPSCVMLNEPAMLSAVKYCPIWKV